MKNRRHFIKFPFAAALAAGMALTALPSFAQPLTLLNVSYDPTRELYVEYNQAFARHWKAKTGQEVAVKQSHGGSGKQARSIIDGIDADVATLALGGDVDALAAHGGLVKPDWQKRLPHNSAPYTSTIVFLVKKGNPKGLKDWDDLIKPSVAVVAKVVDKKGTRAVAEEYLKYLYSDEGQDIAGRNFYRPTGEKAKAKYDKQFPKLTLVTIDQAFGVWAKADKEHFADGASFDQIYTKK